MSCECYQIGGRFIAEDPDCPAHGDKIYLQDIDRLQDRCDQKDFRISELEAEVLQLRDRLEQAIAVACSASNDAERALREEGLL